MFGVTTSHISPTCEVWRALCVDLVKRLVPISDNYIWMMWTFHNDLCDTWYDRIHRERKVETCNGSWSIILISRITLARVDSWLLPGDRQVKCLLWYHIHQCRGHTQLTSATLMSPPGADTALVTTGPAPSITPGSHCQCHNPLVTTQRPSVM